MKLYPELTEAIKETVGNIDETSEFKARFTKLIENYFDKSCNNADITELIELVQIGGEPDNGD